MKKILMVPILSLLLLAPLMPIHSALGATKVKVVFMAGFTGIFSVGYTQALMGTQDYVKHLKKIGDPVQMEVVVKDTQYKPPVAKQLFEEIADAEDQFVVFGTGAGTSLAIKQDIEESNIIFIPLMASPILNKGTKNIFAFQPTYIGQAFGVLQAVKRFVKKGQFDGTAKVAIVTHPSAFGRTVLPAWPKMIKDAKGQGVNMELILQEEHPLKGSNAGAFIRKIKDKGINLVLFHTAYPYTANYLKEAHNRGLAAKSFGESGKISFAGTYVTGGTALVKTAGPAANGFHYATYTQNIHDDNAYTVLAKKLAKENNRSYDDDSYHTGLVNAMALHDLLKECQRKYGKINYKNLHKLMNQSSPITIQGRGTVAPLTWGKNDRNGVDHVSIYSIDNGRVNTVIKALRVPTSYK